ncbi:MAG: type II toxin-antitoxin system RelE/ParE family toxin [Gammaproteobacteria bacterium]
MDYLIEQTEVFSAWLARLTDMRVRIAIARRVERVSTGNFGDMKTVGGGVSELRIDIGPGYRVYFTRRRGVVIVLLCGGDKRRQQADIKRAQKLAKELRQ